MSGMGAEIVKAAYAPFDNVSTADVIFRTSDGVHFYAHKIILSIASTFFEAMFSLPEPLTCHDRQDTLNGIPVVEVPEDSVTFDSVLRYCYPVRNPLVGSLERLDRLIGVAVKYALDQAVFLAVAELRSFLSNSPLQVYAVSCRHGLKPQIKSAAAKWKKLHNKCIKKTSFLASCASECYHTTMEDLPAGSYYRLVEYVSTKGDIGDMLGRPLTVIVNIPAKLALDSYPFNQTGTDAVLVAKDGTKFPVHRVFVEMQIFAAPVFPLQSLILPPTPDGTNDDGKAVYLTHADPVVLSRLLRMCYPTSNDGGILQWNDEQCCSAVIIQTVAAALRYGMVPIVDTYKSVLRNLITKRPLDALCISFSFGWYAEAHSAAKYMARHVVLPYATSPWIDAITAKQYHHILRFWYDCQDAMASAMYQIFPPCTPKDLQWGDTWWAHEGTPEARRESCMTQRIFAEAMSGNSASSASSSTSSVTLDSATELKAFVRRGVELEAKFDEAITSVEFRLC